MDVLVSLNATGILDITQARSYFAETRLTYGDPEYVSRVLLVIHSLQLGYRMIRPGCSSLIDPKLIGVNIGSNASYFGELRPAKDETLVSYVAQMSQHKLQHIGFRWVVVQ